MYFYIKYNSYCISHNFQAEALKDEIHIELNSIRVINHLATDYRITDY